MAQELIDKIRAAAQAKGIDPDIALQIARAESSVDPSAKAKSSSAGGVFQVVDKTWKEFGGAPGKKFDPDENIRVGTDIIAKNTQTLKGFLNRDPRPAEIYAAHYFGPSGAKSFLAADPATPIVDVLGKAAVKANPNLQGKTTGQVLASLEKKMGGAPASAQAPTVSRETPPEQTPAERVMEPALRSGMSAQAPAPAPDKLASLGPGYQAALALSFLADTDEKEDRDIDREPGVAEKYLAEMDAAPRTTALAGFSDLSIKSPFAEPQRPQMFNEGGEVEEPGLLSVPTYSRTVSYEMYPGQSGQFDQQDAARHMLASGTLARKYGPTAAEMLGKLHEIGTSPLRFIGSKLGISDMPEDYEQDLHNNRLGIELGKRSKNQKDLEDLVQQLAEQAKGQRMEGKPWTGRPVKRSDGGDAAPTEEEIAAASRPATVNPNIRRQGEAARKLAAMRDVNTLPDPRTYAAVSGFLGTAPDEMGFSALHPQSEGIKKAGEAGFYAGTAAQVAPMMGALRAAGIGPSSAGRPATAAQQLGAVKMRGGTFGYTGEPGDSSKLGYLMSELTAEAKSARAPQELQDFLKAKAPKYFSTTYGTADDPLRTAIRERRIEPFGRDQPKLTPYMIDAATNPEARGHLQAKLDLERMYDEMSGVRAYAFKPEGSDITERAIRKDISEKMGQEGVPIEARNPPSVDTFSTDEFAAYPTSSRMLRQLVENQETLPPNIQQALRTGEPVFDVDPNMALLRPNNIIEALEQVPVNKLKNMSFPEALIQGTQALAPVRDYRLAVDLAAKGAAVPRQALDMFTEPVTKAPSLGGQWVQLTKPVATELEGKLMKHSVGGYGAGDSYGTSYTGLPVGGKKAFDEGLVQVYSLRNKQGLPEVTLEMAKSNAGKGDTWDVTQIRGRFNSEPALETREDIFLLLDKIEGGKGLNIIKPNSYNNTRTGETVPGTAVDWGREYDLWKQGASE